MTTPPQIRKRRAGRNNREARLRWSRNANAAKAQKRMESPPPDPEPKFEKWNRFEITVKDRLTGETGSFELRSLRDCARRLAIVTRYLT